MVHTGLFKITALVYLIDCSYNGLFKIIALEICQTKNIPMLKSGHSHSSDGDGIRKIKISCGNFESSAVCGCYIQWSQGWVVRSKSYEIVR